MREILFRGKRLDNGAWVEGYYVHLYDCKGNETHRIYPGDAETDCGDYYPEWFEVDPATIGQYTGLTDKNDTKIFEGDIIHTPEWKGCDKSVVIFESGMFKAHNMSLCTWSIPDYEYEVIGNIHEKPPT